MAERTALYDLTYEQLADLLAGWGEPRYRADQVWRWLYCSLASDVEPMTNLPSTLRAHLSEEADLSPLTPLAEQVSVDRQTHKVLFGLCDGNSVESVLMLYNARRTVCLSTQSGCAMGCTFCATGQGGLARNLSAGEIVAQVIFFAREVRRAQTGHAATTAHQGEVSPHPITNLVLMGMGEPLANYDATRQAIETLCDVRGFNLGLRRMTLSTVGLVPGIRRLAEERLPINLAVSLHAAADELRNRLVPVNRRFPLADLLTAVREYVDKTGRRVSIEYALIAGVNDSIQQAQQLSRLLQGLLCHVNLILLNPTSGSSLQPASRAVAGAFRDTLQQAGIATTVRMRRGLDIEAGCGQLRRAVDRNRSCIGSCVFGGKQV